MLFVQPLVEQLQSQQLAVQSAVGTRKDTEERKICAPKKAVTNFEADRPG